MNLHAYLGTYIMCQVSLNWHIVPTIKMGLNFVHSSLLLQINPGNSPPQYIDGALQSVVELLAGAAAKIASRD